jgi:hypothetical protein
MGGSRLNMDRLYLPVRYEGLAEKDVQAHLRHSAANLPLGSAVEFLFCEAGIVIPMVRHIYRGKPSTLDVLIRSGSIDRDRLVKLKESLLSEGYALKISFTSKRRLLRRLEVRLPVDGTIAVSGLNILKSISSALDLSWPTSIAVGYEVGSEALGLPGNLSYREPFRNAGYQLGHAIGRLLRRVIL